MNGKIGLNFNVSITKKLVLSIFTYIGFQFFKERQ